ncbi:hypothetical protein 2 [Wenling crustacean virus 11]|uniref:Uncharacterized protein n=1 Tax=Wenling crustacean virus 11 TaxID=1923480 RepID=A0A1L3KN87_9RHAB|nr:hypothetical protein 2 [Wenling crustacean virus 11]APG78833.1 hypothetical protein 2 [Wenling crustacean virus 11]
MGLDLEKVRPMSLNLSSDFAKAFSGPTNHSLIMDETITNRATAILTQALQVDDPEPEIDDDDLEEEDHYKTLEEEDADLGSDLEGEPLEKPWNELADDQEASCSKSKSQEAFSTSTDIHVSDGEDDREDTKRLEAQKHVTLSALLKDGGGSEKKLSFIKAGSKDDSSIRKTMKTNAADKVPIQYRKQVQGMLKNLRKDEEKEALVSGFLAGSASARDSAMKEAIAEIRALNKDHRALLQKHESALQTALGTIAQMKTVIDSLSKQGAGKAARQENVKPTEGNHSARINGKAIFLVTPKGRSIPGTCLPMNKDKMWVEMCEWAKTESRIDTVRRIPFHRLNAAAFKVSWSPVMADIKEKRMLENADLSVEGTMRKYESVAKYWRSL